MTSFAYGKPVFVQVMSEPGSRRGGVQFWPTLDITDGAIRHLINFISREPFIHASVSPMQTHQPSETGQPERELSGLVWELNLNVPEAQIDPEHNQVRQAIGRYFEVYSGTGLEPDQHLVLLAPGARKVPVTVVDYPNDRSRTFELEGSVDGAVMELIIADLQAEFTGLTAIEIPYGLWVWVPRTPFSLSDTYLRLGQAFFSSFERHTPDVVTAYPAG